MHDEKPLRKSASNRRRFLKVAGSALAASSVGLAGCTGNSDGGATESSPTATQSESGGGETESRATTTTTSSDVSLPNQIRVGHPSPAQPIYNFAVYPELQNRLQDAGSGIKRKVFKGYTPMAAAFIKDELDLAYLTVPAIVKARAQGLPIVAISGYVQEYVFPLIVKPNISSWEDMKNKTIAMHSPSAMSTVIMTVMFRDQFGVDFQESDMFNVKQIIGSPNRISAMAAGEAQISSVLLANALAAEKEGVAKIFANPWEFDRLSRQTAAVWVTLKPTLEEKTELLGKLIETMKKSYDEMYNKEPQKIVDNALSTGIYPEIDKNVWIQTLKQARDVGLWPKGGSISEEQLTKAQDLLVNTGLIQEKNRVPYNEFVDDRFI